MPAQTHQHGQPADPETVVTLLVALLSDEEDVADDAVLADLGVGPEDLGNLWGAVCEELAERTVGPELDPSDLDTNMTLSEAAKAIAWLLAGNTSGKADG